MLIHTLPPRRMCRLMAIRAGSICRLVTYAGVSAWMPYSPNARLLPPLEAPSRPGWCCLRCLTRRGISMGSRLLGLGRGRSLGGGRSRRLGLSLATLLAAAGVAARAAATAAVTARTATAVAAAVPATAAAVAVAGRTPGAGLGRVQRALRRQRGDIALVDP